MVGNSEDIDLFLRFTANFSGIRVIDSKMIPTKWTIKSDLILQENLDDFDFNYVLIKVKFALESIMNGSIFFSMENDWAIDAFLMTDVENNVVITPGDPTDDLITMLLHSKMNALGEGMISFGGVDLQSDTSSGLGFIFLGNGSSLLPTMTDWIGDASYFKEPWWNRDDASTMDIVPEDGADLTEVPEFAFKLDFLKDAMRPTQPDAPITTAKVLRPEFKPVIIKNEKK
jgi:hypothetical protein